MPALNYVGALMWMFSIALAGTRSDQLSSLSDVLEPMVEQARQDPALASELAANRLAMLDPEGALEAASWAPGEALADEVAVLAELMLKPRDGLWLSTSNRWCLDMVTGGRVDAAFEKCVHSDLETRMLRGVDREVWSPTRSAVVAGLGARLLGEVKGVRIDGQVLEVLHQVTLTEGGIEQELAVCPDGCSDLRLGNAWNGMTDDDRQQVLERQLWGVTRFELVLKDGLVVDVLVAEQSLSALLSEELVRELAAVGPVPGTPGDAKAPGAGTPVAPDAPGGGPATGDTSRWRTWLAAILGVMSLAGLWWVSRKRETPDEAPEEAS